MQELQYAPLPERALIRLSGSESVPFLNALLSRDISSLTAERALHAGLLTPKGKLSFDFLVAAITDDEIFIDCDASQRDALIEKLCFYRLRTRVVIEAEERCPQDQVIAVWGRGVLERFSLSAEPGATVDQPETVVFVDPRLPKLGVRILLRTSSSAAKIAPLQSARPIDARAYRRHRLSLGVPEGHEELPQDQFFPWEASLDLLDGISLDKGCFIGQEIVSRVYRKGKVSRRLMPLVLHHPKDETPEPGDAIRQNGEVIGSLHVRIGAQALALMQMDRIGNRVAPICIGDTGVDLVVPDWMRET